MGDAESGKANVVFGALFLALSIFTLVMTYQLVGPDREHFSIRTFPAFVALGMLVLSTLLLAKGIRTVQAEARHGDQDTERSRVGLREAVLRPFVVRFALFALLGLIYTQVIRAVGFVVATPALVFGAMLLYGDRKWYRLILLPLIITVVLYHLFRTLFQVPLPRFGLW